MMHLFSCAIACLVASVALAAEVPPPGGGSCWSSTLAIVGNEINAALNPTVGVSVERKYVFCSDTVYKIVGLNPPANASLGEQSPIVLFTPNVHLYCPGNCTLEMQTETVAIFGATTTLVQGFGVIPAGATAPPSRLDNLIVDGFTIRNVDNTIFEDTSGVLTLGPPGMDMMVRNCDFSSVGTSGWAIAAEYYASEAVLYPNTTAYSSLTIEDCTFSDSVFDRAAIISFAVDAPPPADALPVIQLTMKRLTFTNNTNTGVTRGGEWMGLLAMEDIAEVTVSDLCFIDNVSPNGTLIAIDGMASVDGMSIYEVGTTALNDEDCLGGVFLAGECIAATATACFSDPPAMMTDAPTMSPDMTTDAPSSVGFMSLSNSIGMVLLLTAAFW